jgi:hypothetical protein|nr:MAG TPA: hypothetical protein [Caudoviricetes sp.]
MELKRVYINYGERDLNNCFLIFGSAKDIEKEYEQLERDGYTPFYNESPKFNYDKNYAILVEQKDSYDTVVTEFYQVITEEDFLMTFKNAMLYAEEVWIR